MADIDKALADLENAISEMGEDSDEISAEEMKGIITESVSQSLEESKEEAELSTYRTTTEKPKPVTIVDISDNVLNKLSTVMSQFASVTTDPVDIEVSSFGSIDETFFEKIFRWVKDGFLKVVQWISELIGWALDQIVSAVRQVGKFIMMKMMASIAASSAGRMMGGGRRGGKWARRAALGTTIAGLTGLGLIASGKGDEMLKLFAPGYANMDSQLQSLAEETKTALANPEEFIESSIKDSSDDLTIEPLDPAKIPGSLTKSDIPDMSATDQPLPESPVGSGPDDDQPDITTSDIPVESLTESIDESTLPPPADPSLPLEPPSSPPSSPPLEGPPLPSDESSPPPLSMAPETSPSSNVEINNFPAISTPAGEPVNTQQAIAFLEGNQRASSSGQQSTAPQIMVIQPKSSGVSDITGDTKSKPQPQVLVLAPPPTPGQPPRVVSSGSGSSIPSFSQPSGMPSIPPTSSPSPVGSPPDSPSLSSSSTPPSSGEHPVVATTTGMMSPKPPPRSTGSGFSLPNISSSPVSLPPLPISQNYNPGSVASSVMTPTTTTGDITIPLDISPYSAGQEGLYTELGSLRTIVGQVAAASVRPPQIVKPNVLTSSSEDYITSIDSVRESIPG